MALSQTPVFSLRRQLPCSTREVFEAWTEPRHFVQWWAPPGMLMVYCTIDLRPGGQIRHCLALPDGREVWSRGVYRLVEPGQTLVYADSFTDPQGNPVAPSYYGIPSDLIREPLITLRFQVLGLNTAELTLECEDATTDEERYWATQMWNQIFDRLEQYLTTGFRAG
jgi:uncharacterized protein YndB with AHSA1/START domain